MVEIVFEQDSNGRDIGFEAKGHAGYADAGEDIVCAAISAIMQTAVLGFLDVLKIDAPVLMEEGNLSFRLPERLSPDVQEKAAILLETMRLGLESIRIDREECLMIRNRRIKNV